MKVFCETADAALLKGLRLLSGCGVEETSEHDADVAVTAVPRENGLRVRYDGERTATVEYSRRVEFYRGISHLLDAFAKHREIDLAEEAHFASDGFMLDCSRNAAPKVSTLLAVLSRMALMGLDTVQLYTEDMYTLEGRPYFGYMRGRYTDAELTALDDAANLLGIEVVPCIQTLAHLSTVLRWNAFAPLVDCNDIMLAGEEETYALVTEMVAKMRKCFRSRRINIGMDEAHMLGLGNYRAKHGLRDAADIMCEHIARVLDICRQYGFTPMMWSDMFFHMVSGSYNDAGEGIPQEIIRKVPQGVELIYWEYYNRDRETYRRVMRQHRAFENPIAFAGCAWKWNGLLPELAHSLEVSRIALTECLRAGIADVFATAWGDDGAECPLMTVLPVLQLYAEINYAGGDVGDDVLADRFFACTGGHLEDFLSLDTPNRTTPTQKAIGQNPTKYLLYQDVLEGLFDRHVAPEFPAFFSKKRDELSALAGRNPAYGYLFAFEAALCDLLSVKCDAGVKLREAYKNGDRDTLTIFAEKDIPLMMHKLCVFTDAFYESWMRENKPFGFDVIDIRLGGVRNRMVTAQKRLRAYLSGEAESLEELEEERLFFDGREDPDADINTFCNTYTRIATASVF